MHGIRAVRLHPDHFAIRLQLLDGVCNAADKSATANRDNHRVNFLTLLMDFQSNCACTRRNFTAFEWMYEKSTFLPLDPLGDLERFVNTVHEHHFAAERSARIDSCRIRRTDHHDLGACTDRLGGECGCYGVITRTDRCDTDLSLLRTKTVYGRKRATRFKRSCSLQELEFAVYDSSITERILERRTAQ